MEPPTAPSSDVSQQQRQRPPAGQEAFNAPASRGGRVLQLTAAPDATARYNGEAPAPAPPPPPQASQPPHSGAIPLLTTVWLDADRYTYEALCTAGAAAITVGAASALKEEEGERLDSEEQQQQSSPGRARQDLFLFPHESSETRKRTRSGACKSDSSNHTTKDAMERRRDSLASLSSSRTAASVKQQQQQQQQPEDADARLDVLEEVELCSVVPVLPRTFGTEQIVQQVVPGTASLLPRQTAEKPAGGGEALEQRPAQQQHRRRLEQLRAAADQHSTALRGHTRASSCAEADHCTHADVPLPSCSACGCPPSVPATMRASIPETRERLAAARGTVCEEGSPLTSLELELAGQVMGNDTHPPLLDSPPPLPAASRSSRPSSPVQCPPGFASSVGVAVGEPPATPIEAVNGAVLPAASSSSSTSPSTPHEAASEDGSDAPMTCLSFAVAQAVYEHQQRQPRSSFSFPRDGPASSPAENSTLPAAQRRSFNEEGSARELFPKDCEAEAVLRESAAPTTTTAAKDGQSSDSECSSSAAVKLWASAAAHFLPPSSSSPPSLHTSTSLSGAIVEWANGAVSYTADTEGLMQEQQVRAQRFFSLPPPLPASSRRAVEGMPREGQREEEEDCASLSGAVLAQLQRLRGGPQVAGLTGSSSSSSNSTDAPSTPQPPRHTSKQNSDGGAALAEPCTCYRCCPLQFQFAQVPSLASPVLRRYMEVLHQTSLPTLQHPYPPAPTPPTPPTPPPTSEATPSAVTVQRKRSRLSKRRGATSEKDQELGNTVHTPASMNAANSKERQQRRTVVDAIDVVFPAVHSWCAEQQQQQQLHEAVEASGPLAFPPTSATLAAVPQSETSARVGSNAQPEQSLMGGADASYCAAPPKRRTTGLSSPFPTAPLHWVDDAVLDEVVVVGVVPRGRPHQLRLVAPSRAFALVLLQRLEESSDVAVRVLTNLTRSTEAAAQYPCRTDAEWQAWLRTRYFQSLRQTLLRQLTSAEWSVLAQLAQASPFAPLRRAVLSTAEAVDAETVSSPAMPQGFGADTAELLREIGDDVRAAAVAHTRACIAAAEDATARIILTALTPLLHRRLTVMYELLRHFASKSLYASHRAQCEAYQQWYATTSSPAAVLRLLQRSGRFSRALARCYPQYALTPIAAGSGSEGEGSGDDPTLGRGSHSDATAEFPAHPPPASAASPLRKREDTRQTTPNDATAAGPSPDKSDRDTSLQRNSGDATMGAAAAQTEETTPALHPPLVPLPTSSTAAAAAPGASTTATPTTETAIPWSPTPVYPVTPSKDTRSPLSAASPNSPASSSPGHEATSSPVCRAAFQDQLVYVPEVALLDPRYLQRFAWWTHRTHHSGGNHSHSHSIASHTASATVMSIPGDYLRVVPLQEQDAGIRTVLRCMAQKGRTLDLWEMSQHIQTHHSTPYVYR